VYVCYLTLVFREKQKRVVVEEREREQMQTFRLPGRFFSSSELIE